MLNNPKVKFDTQLLGYGSVRAIKTDNREFSMNPASTQLSISLSNIQSSLFKTQQVFLRHPWNNGAIEGQTLGTGPGDMDNQPFPCPKLTHTCGAASARYKCPVRLSYMMFLKQMPI